MNIKFIEGSVPIKSTIEPIFYTVGQSIFKKPMKGIHGTTMGFKVCEVSEQVDAGIVAEYLNIGYVFGEKAINDKA